MRKSIIISFIFILFLSCKSLILNLITPNDVKKSLKVMKRENQTIVYLPMVHLGKQNYFDQVKVVIDSLKKEGFTVFYEQISIDKKQTKDSLDIKIRKLRKLMGLNIVGGYNNEENKSLPKAFKAKKYISQNNFDLGIDSLDIIADVTLSELIIAHENKKGKISLSDCDMNTGLNEKYKCQKISNYYAIHTFRDSIASKIVLEANKKKSLIIFGKNHWYGIWPNFRDEGFVLNE